MPVAKVAVTLDRASLRLVDELVQRRVYPSRSRVIQEAVEEKLARINKSRLARECAKLEPGEERALAEEGMSAEVDRWPAF